MEKRVSEIMEIKDRELKEALTCAKKLEEYGLYKKQDTEQIEYAIKQKQEKRHAMLWKIIHEELIKELDEKIERTRKDITERRSKLQKQLKARVHANVSNYTVEIRDYKETQWVVDIEFLGCESEFLSCGNFTETLFIDKEEKK